MPQRLVTDQDLQDNPELEKQGVSVNQMYDFPDTTETAPDAEEMSEKHIKKTGKKVDDENNPKEIDPKASQKSK